MRVDYGSVEKDGSPDLDVGWLADGWVVLLRKWIDDAERAGVAEPNAMVLATADADGRPMSRTVLCKSVDDTGITFFTNYDSAKGAELAANPYASATFPWFALGRQVHVRGPVSKVTAEATADYWSKRPRGSQLGRMGVGAVTADSVAGRAAAATREGHRALRRRRTCAGPTELGRLPDHRRGRRVLAGPGEPVAQQDPGAVGADRASPALNKP